MPSAVMGPRKEGYVWIINDADYKMYVPEGTIMVTGQDWEEEEEHEIVEYSEPMGAVRGVGDVIPEHMKDMFDRASAGVWEYEAVGLKLLLIKYLINNLDRFADTAACLYRLTGAKVKFDWSEEEEDPLKKLKEAITEAPLLVYPKEGGGFVLDTDASDKAIGAVLSQVQDGKEMVVAYGSFVMSTAHCCVTRRELLAIVVLAKHFRHYLLGNKFNVTTIV